MLVSCLVYSLAPKMETICSSEMLADFHRSSFLTNRKVAGSSPDDVDFLFNLSNPCSRTMALGSTQPLEMSARNLPDG
jgi:hypothetical protein